MADSSTNCGLETDAQFGYKFVPYMPLEGFKSLSIYPFGQNS